MNTSTSDMASFPIPPLGSHWFHESDLIGDLFDLTICIIIFRCPTDGISIALVQSEAIIFKIVPIGFEIYICMLAVRPAVSHMLSLSTFDRVLWLLVVLVFLAVAAALTLNLWTQWRNEQVMKTIREFCSDQIGNVT